MIKIKDFIDLLIQSGVLQDCVFYQKQDLMKIPVDIDTAYQSVGNLIDLDLCCVEESPYIEVVYE